MYFFPDNNMEDSSCLKNIFEWQLCSPSPPNSSPRDSPLFAHAAIQKTGIFSLFGGGIEKAKIPFDEMERIFAFSTDTEELLSGHSFLMRWFISSNRLAIYFRKESPSRISMSLKSPSTKRPNPRGLQMGMLSSQWVSSAGVRYFAPWGYSSRKRLWESCPKSSFT